jgi:alkylation response protein AidB-like acyl-CoA dehydrogenase
MPQSICTRSNTSPITVTAFIACGSATAANFFDLANGVPCLPGPLYQAVRQFLPLMHGASSVGIAEGALDELVEPANTGQHQLQAAVPMRDSETFQGELGRVAAELKAARAFLQVQAASHWRHLHPPAVLVTNFLLTSILL